MSTERDTHYQFWARTLWNELDPLLSELCIERADSKHPYVLKVVQDIQKRIAQAAYDLVETEKAD